MIRILLVEDHSLVRAGIRALLAGLDDMTVVAEASDAEGAIRQVAQQNPDMVLMDIALPGVNGLELTAHFRRTHPQLQVIILSMYADEEYVLQALRVGAKGYLLKDSSIGELELAIRAVMRGEAYLSPLVSRHVVSAFVKQQGGDADANGARSRATSHLKEGLATPNQLTPRQREILRLIAQGQTTQGIANQLSISIKTVETHRAQLMERLNIHSIAGLVRYAVHTGLVSLDD
ncbi:MAG: response regulator transcription factor [Anaerolineae bacterium]|uniref:response regulator transcription factor n=1 Tax=Candidatus Amarolinea dominans TaxID=3140696 RepID=UPI001DE113FE|nr:response regulator transcription factor [Anaerolineae bacterium]